MMAQQIYQELADWYCLLDPAEAHAEEARVYGDALAGAIVGGGQSLLELGSGAGHNALFLKRDFACTLSDVSRQMLDVSRSLNPECEHILGDMRTMRLDRTFDAVLAHDSLTYMLTVSDLRSAAETAFVHTRPGGAAIFTPDWTTETFQESTSVIEGSQGERAMRCLDWTWDPDPNDTTVQAEYVFVLREQGKVRTVHDQHIVGLFPRTTWVQTLKDVGYRVDTMERPIGEGKFDEVFLCRRSQ